jgi:hypothetical protein
MKTPRILLLLPLLPLLASCATLGRGRGNAGADEVRTRLWNEAFDAYSRDSLRVSQADFQRLAADYPRTHEGHEARYYLGVLSLDPRGNLDPRERTTIDVTFERVAYASTAFASSRLVVTRIARASGSCSACARRSAAIQSARPRSDHTTISLGPAWKSIAQSGATSALAAATHALPGPTILSARVIDAVPYASAAMACAPPSLSTRVAPASMAAQQIAGVIAGQTTVIWRTPAVRAGTTVMIRLETSGNLPPGT